MEDYKGSHESPNEKNGAPLHDLTANGVYPDDVYGNKAYYYYGHGEDVKEDKNLLSKIHAYKNKPEATVEIHRAIPRDVSKETKINKGDWVTISKNYAREHGEGPLGGDYRVISQRVPAKHLFTNGDSPYEFGYHPHEIKKSK